MCYTLGAWLQNPAEPPRARAAGQSTGAQTDAPERIGPLAIARHVKDDGRALILYTRDEQPPA